MQSQKRFLDILCRNPLTETYPAESSDMLIDDDAWIVDAGASGRVWIITVTGDAAIVGDDTGTVTGDVTEDAIGNATAGDVTAAASGDVTATAMGDVTGDAIGNRLCAEAAL